MIRSLKLFEAMLINLSKRVIETLSFCNENKPTSVALPKLESAEIIRIGSKWRFQICCNYLPMTYASFELEVTPSLSKLKCLEIELFRDDSSSSVLHFFTLTHRES